MRIILGGIILQDNVGIRTEDTENMKFLHQRCNSCITQMSPIMLLERPFVYTTNSEQLVGIILHVRLLSQR